MSGTAPRRPRKPPPPVATSREEATRMVAEIGDLQRRRTLVEAAMNEELAGVRERHEREALPMGEAIRSLSAAVQAWCEANREQLCPGGRKTASLASGEVLWRLTPPRVTVRAAETVIATLRRLDLARFVRTREEVNKEAILAEPEAVRGIAGITIGQAEEFAIRPFETRLEEVA